MSGCCRRESYDRLFGARQARLDAARYRRRGLRGTSRDLVELAGDVAGATVLEVGGGVGAIEIELLTAGADRATNVELSGGYEEAAAALLAERGLGERVERRVGDFVTELVEPHDIVVMHRVVCCYPDVDRLVETAAACTRRRLLLTYPRERPWVRAGARAINVFLRLSGSSFRAFVHPVARMTAAAGKEGSRWAAASPTAACGRTPSSNGYPEASPSSRPRASRRRSSSRRRPRSSERTADQRSM